MDKLSIDASFLKKKQKKERKQRYCKHCGNIVYYGRCCSCKKASAFLTFLHKSSIVLSILLIFNVTITILGFSMCKDFENKSTASYRVPRAFDSFCNYNFLTYDISYNKATLVEKGSHSLDYYDVIPNEYQCFIDCDAPEIFKINMYEESYLERYRRKNIITARQNNKSAGLDFSIELYSALKGVENSYD